MLFTIKKGKNQPDEKKLLEQYRQSGNLEYLGLLYQPYMHLVYGVCLKYLKDRESSRDAVMQVFEKLVIELRIRQVNNFKAWLYVLTKNYCLMALRSEKAVNSHKKKSVYDLDFFVEIEEPLHPNNEPSDKMLEILKVCIEELKTTQHDCVKLFYLEEKSYLEISQLLGIEMNMVKSHIQNGKRNLKICIEKHG